MTETSAKDDIADLMKRLTEPVGTRSDEPSTEVVRLLVATDWTSAAVPLTLLKAFRAIVPKDSPVQLAFAVPHEPTSADAVCVSVLADGAGDKGNIAGLEVLSFEQAAVEPYDAAVVPNGQDDELITQVGGLVVRMHDLMRRFETSGQGSATSDPTMNAGDSASLHRRLAQFTA